jgi:hypothetical protein
MTSRMLTLSPSRGLGGGSSGHSGDLLDGDVITPPLGLNHTGSGASEGGVVPPERARATLMASAPKNTALPAEFIMTYWVVID